MTDSWDSSKPNLSKLPPHIREGLHQPIPLQPGEMYARTTIFKNIHQKGLNHPKARMMTLPYREDETAMGPYSGVQTECRDFKGRESIYAFRLKTENVIPFLETFIKAAIKAGVDKEKIKELLNE